jgi:hypothetical protein
MNNVELVILFVGLSSLAAGFILVYLNKKDIKELKEEIKIAPIVDEPWIRFEDEKPPHEVVLAACYTYDCGWAIYTAWWYEDKKCWMMTGNDKNPSHLEFTHWRLLPDEPVDAEAEAIFD